MTTAAGDIAERVVSKVVPIERVKVSDCGCIRDPLADGRVRCRPCEEHAQELREKRDRERRELESAEREENAERYLRAVGVYREHATARLEEFSAEIRERADAWRPDDRSGLLVKGPTGTGKTRLAAALARAFIVAGASVSFVTCGDLFSRIRATFRDQSEETEESLVDGMKSVGLLVIDDLGNEGTVSNHVRSVLHRVFSARNGDFCPTIVTTNLKASEIRDVYGNAIASRLEPWEHLVVDGPDRRRRG